MRHDEEITDEFYLAWCEAEFKANCIYDELDEDFTHPRFLEASRESRIKLDAFLSHPASSLQIVILKLEIACECEDFYTDAADPDCIAVAPRAVVAAIKDLENMRVA